MLVRDMCRSRGQRSNTGAQKVVTWAECVRRVRVGSQKVKVVANQSRL